MISVCTSPRCILLDQVGHGNIVTAPLQRRPGDIDGLSEIPQRSIERVHYHLDRYVIRAAHNQGLTAMFPELVSHGVQAFGNRWGPGAAATDGMPALRAMRRSSATATSLICEGGTATRTSALLPVTDIPDSN